jgi:hypothetical protein
LAYAAWGLGFNTPYTVQRIPVEKTFEVFKPGVDCINPNVKKVVENVVICEDGGYYVNVIGMRFIWLPCNIVLTDPKEVKFRVTSPDIIHGFQIASTNVNVMVFPGYIAEITWKVPANMLAGKYLNSMQRVLRRSDSPRACRQVTSGAGAPRHSLGGLVGTCVGCPASRRRAAYVGGVRHLVPLL